MRIVLAYSGLLEGSIAIPWLRERHKAEIVAVTLDLGQGRTLEATRDRALALGAHRAHVLDARDLFAREFIMPALRADALHDGRVPMALALSRPLIAQKLVEIAGIERADAVAHTGHATLGGQSRLDRLLSAVAPALPVITPAREWRLGDGERAAFARRHGLAASADDGARVEANFWGRSVRQQSDAVALESSLFASKPPAACPDEPATVDIAFERGVPTALNNVALPLTELVGSLDMLAATHGVGQTQSDGLLCDAPAAVLLHAAHRDLTRASSTPELERFSSSATSAYTSLVESARWFTPFRVALDAYFAAAQAQVSGHVRLRLFKGEHSTLATELSQLTANTPALSVVSSAAQH